MCTDASPPLFRLGPPALPLWLLAMLIPLAACKPSAPSTDGGLSTDAASTPRISGVSGTRDTPGALAAADPQRGRQLMAHYQCGRCHVATEVPAAAGRIGPPLDGFGQRSYIAGELPNTPDNLVRWLRDPQAAVPGAAMPRMGLSEADARDVAAYLLRAP